jgi:hypothetical protein
MRILTLLLVIYQSRLVGDPLVRKMDQPFQMGDTITQAEADELLIE